VVVLAAKLEIAHHNSDLGASKDQNQKHDEQKAKDVVELLTPNRRQNEEQLDKHSTKRQDTTHQN
jgi:hypothetical protein